MLGLKSPKDLMPGHASASGHFLFIQDEASSPLQHQPVSSSPSAWEPRRYTPSCVPLWRSRETLHPYSLGNRQLMSLIPKFLQKFPSRDFYSLQESNVVHHSLTPTKKLKSETSRYFPLERQAEASMETSLVLSTS